MPSLIATGTVPALMRWSDSAVCNPVKVVVAPVLSLSDMSTLLAPGSLGIAAAELLSAVWKGVRLQESQCWENFALKLWQNAFPNKVMVSNHAVGNRDESSTWRRRYPRYYPVNFPSLPLCCLPCSAS
jgi:hypothetical protein